MDSIKALSVLDGRYAKLTHELKDIFSEYGLIRHRLLVEVQWLKFLIMDLRIVTDTEVDFENIDSIVDAFDTDSALEIKEIESVTNHDVKAVEYYLKEMLADRGLDGIKEWVHFACTSEDINNTAYALMLRAGREVIADTVQEVLGRLETCGKVYKDIPMMARTHGQPASPTTVGKEFINFAWRLREELEDFRRIPIQAKMNGAVGNYNAHAFVFPDVDWIEAGERFISKYLEVQPVLFTTQINSYHYIAKLLHAMIRMAAIIIDLDRDTWGYISLGYMKQKIKEGEVGSSTMPHKVNPIDFENSEGNMGVAISMMEHLSVKLLSSRFQRDLTDSTVLRNLGAIFGYFLIGLKNTLKGLGKIDIDDGILMADLEKNLEILAEPIQTAMRVYAEDEPYEKMKALTRGRKITRVELDTFVDGLEQVPPDMKQRIKRMTVDQYIGLATALVDRYFESNQ